MPIETYVGCLECLQHSAYDCNSWCDNIHSTEARTEGVIHMERLEDGFARVYHPRSKGWVEGKLCAKRWINWGKKLIRSEASVSVRAPK